jgi:Domain of unknown function (DUF4412)
MKYSLFPISISVSFLLQCCSGISNSKTVNKADSLPAQSSSDQSVQQQPVNSTMTPADSDVLPSMPDSNSFTNMKDSVLIQLKDKAGKNGDMIDSVMSMLTNQTSTAETSTPVQKKLIPYHEPLPDDYVIPVSGNGNGLVYEYAGGSIMNGKKGGIAFTIAIDPSKNSGWNMYFDGYAQMNQMNLNINTHYSFLMNNGFTHVLLNNDHKVYTTQKVEQTIQQKNYSVTSIKVTKLGNEKLYGFNCVHAKVSSITHFMGQTETGELDIWRSEEVPGASSLESTIQILVSPITLEMENKLVQAGCKGAILKVSWHDKNSDVIKELIKVTKQEIPDSVFVIPAGYRENKNAALYSLF